MSPEFSDIVSDLQLKPLPANKFVYFRYYYVDVSFVLDKSHYVAKR